MSSKVRRSRLFPAIATGALLALAWWKTTPAPSPRAATDPSVYWSLGVVDHSSDDFATGAEKSLEDEIGRSQPKSAWRQRQNASADYRIRFAMESVPSTA